MPVRWLIGPGLLLVGAGLLLMRGLDVSSDWTHLIPGFIVAGLGCGLVNPPLASTAVGVVEPRFAGMASGINSTFRQVGIATSVAALGSILATHTAGTTGLAARKSAFISGLNEILLIAGLLAIVGGISALALIRPKDFVVQEPGAGAPADGSGATLRPARPQRASRSRRGGPLPRPSPTSVPTVSRIWAPPRRRPPPRVRGRSGRSPPTDVGASRPRSQLERQPSPVLGVGAPLDVAADHQRVDQFARRLLGDPEVPRHVADAPHRPSERRIPPSSRGPSWGMSSKPASAYPARIARP